MDFGHYASQAVSLVNAALDTEADLRSFVGPSTATAARVTGRDVVVLRQARRELRRVFDAGAAGDEATLVAEINQLLARYPISPRISGHDRTSWHLHVNDEAPVGTALVGTALVAAALFGLTLVVTELGADRFGICGAVDCEDVFVDTSPNRSRRFCGDRCATRTNVAAFRRRRSGTKAS